MKYPHFPFVFLDSSIVMPNHLHAVINIDKPLGTVVGGGVETLHCNVSTKNAAMSSISPKPGSLSTILRSFKSAVKKDAEFINPDFEWQPRFHDHIIRDAESYHRITKYIETNIQNWDSDKFRNG